MNQDLEHLRSFAESGSEEAFSSLVRRYLPLVYPAALRRAGGDVQRAEDVTQMVFTALARNAATLTRHPDLTGWLFTTTRFLAAKAVRGDRRRQTREQEAYMTQSQSTDPFPDRPPEALPAVLDDAMMELRQLDRQVLLLRYHRGLRLAEIGAQLGLTENAVQKRVERALELLREKLARRGITSTATALAVAFEQQAAVAVPAGLAAAATGAGLACGTGAAGLFSLSNVVAISKIPVGLAAAALVATSVALVVEIREHVRLRGEIGAQTASVAAGATALRARLDAESRRATAAEDDVAALLQAVQAAAPARAAAAPPPSRAPTDVQDSVDAAMRRGDQSKRDRKFQDALDEYLRCYAELRGKKGRAQIDRQRVMTAIKGLAHDFPPALPALGELRDSALRQLHAQSADRDLISEIGLLNERLDEGARSVALYDSLPAGHPGRQSLGLIAHKAFVELRRYDDALVGKNFGSMLNEFDMGVRNSARLAGKSLANHRDYVVAGTLSNLEVLAGAGRRAEAENLTEKLLAFDGSEATRAAVQRHLERAGRPAPP